MKLFFCFKKVVSKLWLGDRMHSVYIPNWRSPIGLCPLCGRPAKITVSKKVHRIWDSPAGTIITTPYVDVDAVHEDGTDPHVWSEPLEPTSDCADCGHSGSVHIPKKYLPTVPKGTPLCGEIRCECKGFEPLPVPSLAERVGLKTAIRGKGKE